MGFSGPITAIGSVKHGPTPRTGADPKCVIVQIRTPTTKGEFLDMEIAETAAADLANKLVECLDGPHQSGQSLEADLEE